jgi:hypothetical protein
MRGPSISGKRRLRVFLLITVMLALAFGVGRLLFQPATHLSGQAFNQGENAAWLSVDWVNAAHSPDEISALADELVAHKITTIYVFTSYLKEHGAFNTSYNHAEDFVSALHEAAPYVSVQAWLGLPLQYVDLSEDDVRATIADFSTTLVADAGFDGIHLDPEPIYDNDPDVLALLEDVRAALGPEPTLSIATRRLWSLTAERERWVPGRWFWSASYYRQVAARVDEIAVMVYDSALPLAPAYRLWTKCQVIGLSRALDNSDVTLFVGVPASEERTRTHRPAAENVRSGLQGVIDGLNDARAIPSAVAGIAIYPYWEMDTADWETYTRLWEDR